MFDWIKVILAGSKESESEISCLKQTLFPFSFLKFTTRLKNISNLQNETLRKTNNPHFFNPRSNKKYIAIVFYLGIIPLAVNIWSTYDLT